MVGSGQVRKNNVGNHLVVDKAEEEFHLCNEMLRVFFFVEDQTVQEVSFQSFVWKAGQEIFCEQWFFLQRNVANFRNAGTRTPKIRSPGTVGGQLCGEISMLIVSKFHEVSADTVDSCGCHDWMLLASLDPYGGPSVTTTLFSSRPSLSGNQFLFSCPSLLLLSCFSSSVRQ